MAESVLYNAGAGDLENFLAGQRRRDRVVPRFVERELRKFLECGVLANGFLEFRLRMLCCGQDRIVAFSCKGRGICSSLGREEVHRARPRPEWIGFCPGSSNRAVGVITRRPALPAWLMILVW